MPRIDRQQIYNNITEIANRNDYEPTIIYDILLAFGKPKTTITRLKNGTINFANDGGVLLKDNVYFEVYPAGTVLESKVEQLKNDELTERYRPRFLIATDLNSIAAYDRRKETSLSIKLCDLDKDYTFFYALSGNEVNDSVEEETYADRKAAERMKELYDEVVKCNSERILSEGAEFRHHLNVFFSRLLFCYFAEDTGIFEFRQFTNAIKNFTKIDGSDLPEFFEELFRVLDTNDDEKYNLSDPFNKFPYVNGTIFNTKKHNITIPSFNAQSRHLLIQLAESNWSDVNPDIFGTIFQGIVDPNKRDVNGMDYTSVPNIEKVINPLFMDELWEEFEKSKDNTNRLKKLWNRISEIRIFDPACGSGNFLIISYKRLRELEQEIIRAINENSASGLNVELSSYIRLDHFYGIEIEDFPHELAQLSMIIAAHQMNVKFEEEFGKKINILPIKDTPTIVCGNAVRLKWDDICPNSAHIASRAENLNIFGQDEGVESSSVEEMTYDEIYLVGNPPYKGSKKQSADQKADFAYYFSGEDYSKNLDYIALWFIKGARYISGTKAKLAFVSTNSVCQGEHAGIMFPKIYKEYVEIGFAYNSFKWTNNAKDQAGVTVIIISLQNKMLNKKAFYSDGLCEMVDGIGPYLVPNSSALIAKQSKPISDFMPIIRFGSMPNDEGHLLIESKEELDEILNGYEECVKYIKKYTGADDYINNKKRWCLWINDTESEDALSNPKIKERIDLVIKAREGRHTIAPDLKPYKFYAISYKPTNAVIVPRVSSERRKYIPMGFVDKDTIISDAAFAIYDAEPWLLAILESAMHMAWIRTVCGKLKTDYRYSSSLGYNTFPVPPLKLAQKEELDKSAMNILMAREMHSEMTLGQMYDPDKMPDDLRKAHEENDLLVDRLYQERTFSSDEARLVKLFAMYEDMVKNKK